MNYVLHGLVAVVVFVVLLAKFFVVRRYKVYAVSLPALGFYVTLGTILVVLTSAVLELFKNVSN